MAVEKMQLQVPVGLKTVELVDEAGTPFAEIRFNPSDVGIVARLQGLVNYLNTLEIPEDGASVDFVQKFNAEVGAKFDEAFGFPVAGDLFARCSPLSFNNDGDSCLEVITRALIGLVEQTAGERLDAKLGKIRKATGKTPATKAATKAAAKTADKAPAKTAKRAAK